MVTTNDECVINSKSNFCFSTLHQQQQQQQKTQKGGKHAANSSKNGRPFGNALAFFRY